METSQLEELVVGKQPKPRAMFFEQAVLNVPESNRLKRRVYDKKVYIQLRAPGVKDSVSYEAQKSDMLEYAKEYQDFLNSRQGTKAPGVEIIPNLDLAHLQELRDYGILTVRQLAEPDEVPAHLEYARSAAVSLNRVLMEQENAQRKAREESRDEGRKAQDVYEVRGQPDDHHVRRPAAQGSGRSEAGGEAPEGYEAPRQKHHRPSLIDEWKYEFNL